MKKEFLKAYELSDDAVDAIIAEAAKDVSKYADYDELKRKLEAVKDYDDVKASVADWEKKYADKESELSGVKFSHALTDGLKAAGAKNIKATKALLDESTLKLDKDGNITGLDEQLKAIKADNAFLFATEKAEMTPVANIKVADVSTAMSVNKARESERERISNSTLYETKKKLEIISEEIDKIVYWSIPKNTPDNTFSE